MIRKLLIYIIDCYLHRRLCILMNASVDLLQSFICICTLGYWWPNFIWRINHKRSCYINNIRYKLLYDNDKSIFDILLRRW